LTTRLGDWPRASGDVLRFGSARIDGLLARVARPIPVARPLPYVADHVVEAIAVRLEAADRRGRGIAVLVRVVEGEDALPGIGDRLALGIESARPVVLAVAPAARGEFPLRLGRQLAPAPTRIGERILVGDVHDGLIVLAVNRAARACRGAPIRARHVLEPLSDPAAACDIGRRNKHHGPRSEQLLRHAGMRRRIEPALRQRDVSRGRHEFPKLRVGHLVAIDPKAVDTHGVSESLLRPMALGAHDEGSAADEHHPGGLAVVRWQAGIGGAISQLTARSMLLCDGDSTDHHARRSGRDTTEQRAAQRRGGSHETHFHGLAVAA
jgi:hypothetical protein